MPYCDRCDRHFVNWRALEQHKENSSYHHICFDCDDKDFPTRSGLEQHWDQSSQHSYCRICDEHFDDEDELEDHYDDNHHYCRSCGKFFTNQRGLKEHFRQSSNHHYCIACDRHFQSENNLRNHLKSSIHQPKNSRCPFCGATFVSNSHIVLHLEQGTCPSGFDRQAVNRVVRRYDTHNVITDPSRLLTGGSGDEDVTYVANDASWNGAAYECYLCNNTYGSLRALNQHLASPRHQEKFYICRGVSCGSRFTTLSGLWQHIESEKCDVIKFRAVRTTMDSVLGQMKALTFY